MLVGAGEQRPARPFGRLGAGLGVMVVALVAGAMSWSALVTSPAKAQRPVVFGGSLVLADTRPLTVIDLATGQVTVRLEGVDAQVGASNYEEVQPVAVDGGTMLVDRSSGSFNFLGADDYVDDPKGAGVSLGPLEHSTGALGVADGRNAYVLRSGPTSTVSLVGPDTVDVAARTTGPVTPLGSATIAGPLDLSPGGSAVEGDALWALYTTRSGCRAVELTPVATSGQGLGDSTRSTDEAACARDSLESDGSAVGLASPGWIELFGPSGRRTVATPFTAASTRFVPVKGATGQLWFLAGNPGGWTLFGVQGAGIVGPFALSGFAPGALPAVPALSGGFLYTLDETASPQPTLWAIDVTDGHMAPLAGENRYPIRNATEQDDFRAVEVVPDGPRVVFNDPGSLEAVIVFTDGSRPPLAVDKSMAVAVSATGPADLEATPGPTGGDHGSPAPATGHLPTVPAVAAVSQQVTCARTTQKPYAPQVAALTPSPQAVLVRWTYQLLDQTDCEPDSWTVKVTAIDGGHPPAQTTEVVTGEQQYLLTGLRPATTYQVVVTAYINAQQTPSIPAIFTTTARGPDAPLSVSTTADGHGDWVVSWVPCTESANPDRVVPAAEWSVSADSCGGSFVGTPPSIDVPGGTTNVVVSADDLQLLGDSLTFHVQGSLPSGLTGNPASDGTCTQAWEAPTASDLTVGGSGSAAPDGTITATVAAITAGDLATLMSSHPAQVQFVYKLAGESFGPTDLTSAVFEEVPAGTIVTPSVTVYPAGHPGASVTVSGPPFEQTLAWPTETASAVATVDQDNPDEGAVTVTLPAGTPQPTEVTSPDLQCGGQGGATSTLPAEAVGVQHSFSFAMNDLTDTGGRCTLTFTLTDLASPNPYGIPSPVIEADFTIGQVPDYEFRQGYTLDCSDDRQAGNQCGPGGQPWQLAVSLAGAPPGVFAGGDWTVTAEVRDPHSGQEVTPDLCSVASALPAPSFPYALTLPADCPVPQMDDIDVTVSFEYLGRVNQIDAGYPDNKRGTVAVVPSSTTTVATSTTTSTSTTTTTTTPTTTTTTPTTTTTTPTPKAEN